MMVVRILCVLRYRWLLNPRAHIQVKVFAKKPKSVCGTSSLQKKKKKKERKPYIAGCWDSFVSRGEKKVHIWC